MQRLDLWPSRLAAVIEAAKDRPYQLGAWDCPLFVAECIEAMTGVDIRGEFHGRYHDLESARAWMADFSGGGGLGDVAAIVAARIGAQPIPVSSNLQRPRFLI